ncbi:hypothetical protein ES707_22966 [subsurface metagenome]
MSLLAVKFLLANNADNTPFEAAIPACKGLTILPAFPNRPLTKDAAIPKEFLNLLYPNPRIFAAPAAAPKVPIVAVGCHPLS